MIMKKIFSQIVGISLLGFFSVGLAHADSAQPSTGTPPSIALVVTPSLTSARSSASDSSQDAGISDHRKLGWGGGLLLDSPVGSNLSLGVGALYVERKFDIGSPGVTLERKIPTIFVPLEAKIWLGNLLNVGGGVFGAFKVGDVTDTVTTAGGTASVASDSDRNSFEYGLTLSANLLFPVTERTGVIVGAHYFWGLNDAAKSALYDEKINDLAFEAGLSFSL